MNLNPALKIPLIGIVTILFVIATAALAVSAQSVTDSKSDHTRLIPSTTLTSLQALQLTVESLEAKLDRLEPEDFQMIRAFVEQHCQHPLIGEYWLCLNGE